MTMNMRVLDRLLDGGLVTVRSLHLCPGFALGWLGRGAASTLTVHLHQLPH